MPSTPASISGERRAWEWRNSVDLRTKNGRPDLPGHFHLSHYSLGKSSSSGSCAFAVFTGAAASALAGPPPGSAAKSG